VTYFDVRPSNLEQGRGLGPAFDVTAGLRHPDASAAGGVTLPSAKHLHITLATTLMGRTISPNRDR
jgi:hypothetical protein